MAIKVDQDAIDLEASYWVRYAEDHGCVAEVTRDDTTPGYVSILIKESGAWAWAGHKLSIVVGPARRGPTRTTIILWRSMYRAKRLKDRVPQTREGARRWIEIIGISSVKEK